MRALLVVTSVTLFVASCSDSGGLPGDSGAPDALVRDDGADAAEGGAGDGPPRDLGSQPDASKPDGPKPAAQWKPVQGSAPALAYHTATRLQDGTVLVVGGLAIAGGKTSACKKAAHLYDPVKNVFSTAPDLKGARYHHTATLLKDGRVLVAGGRDDQGSLSTVELYDPKQKAWTAGPSLSEARSYHRATPLADGRVLLSGGRNSSGRLASLSLIDAAATSWSSPLTTLSQARDLHAAALLTNGKLLVAGGFDGTKYLDSLEIYDPATGTLTTLTDKLNTARINASAHLLKDGRVLITGGYCSCSPTGDDLYDPVANKLQTISHPGGVRGHHAAAPLADGRVVITGGLLGGGTPAAIKTAVVFSTAGGGGWSSLPAMAASRFRHTATTLADGSVLVVGGQGSSLTSDTVGTAERLYHP
jgi:hypothetical protein